VKELFLSVGGEEDMVGSELNALDWAEKLNMAE
jgi:hypothetical protein